jgi:hypothetical protein
MNSVYSPTGAQTSFARRTSLKSLRST